MLKKILLATGILPFFVFLGIWINGYWGIATTDPVMEYTFSIGDKTKVPLALDTNCDLCSALMLWNESYSRFVEEKVGELGWHNFEASYFDVYDKESFKKATSDGFKDVKIVRGYERVVGLSLVTIDGPLSKNVRTSVIEQHINPTLCVSHKEPWKIDVTKDQSLVPRIYVDNCLHEADFRLARHSSSTLSGLKNGIVESLNGDRFDGMRLFAIGKYIMSAEIHAAHRIKAQDEREQQKLLHVIGLVIGSFLLCVATCITWIVMAIRTARREARETRRQMEEHQRREEELTRIQEEEKKAINELCASIDEVLASPLNREYLDDITLTGEARVEFEALLAKLRMMKLMPRGYGLPAIKVACDQYRQLTEVFARQRERVNDQRSRIRERILFARHHQEYAKRVDSGTRDKIDEFLIKIQSRDSIKPRDLNKIEYDVNLACKRLTE